MGGSSSSEEAAAEQDATITRWEAEKKTTTFSYMGVEVSRTTQKMVKEQRAIGKKPSQVAITDDSSSSNWMFGGDKGYSSSQYALERPCK
ncbi:uncharacterized [Lates japonicus]